MEAGSQERIKPRVCRVLYTPMQSFGKDSAGGHARPHEERPQVIALKQIVRNLLRSVELVFRRYGSLGIVDEPLERVGTLPRGGRIESPFVEGGPPLLAVFLQEVIRSVRVPFGEASDLIDGLLCVSFVELGSPGVDIHYFPGRVAHEARAVVVDHPLAMVGIDVNQSPFPSA